MAAKEVNAAQNGFTTAPASSDWYMNLNRRGSCLRLFDLLKNNPQLLHRTGREGVTVLHKGVRHGCVKLVRHILVDMFDAEGICSCGGCNGPTSPCLTRDDLLHKTCSDGVTAVHMAVVSGSPKMVVLLKWAIDMSAYKEECRRLVEQLPAQESSDGLFERKLVTHEEFEYMEMRMSWRLRLAATDVTSGTENVRSAPVVPDVTDEGFDGIYDSDRDARVREVYALIEGELEKPSDYKEDIEMLKEECRRDVDFEFSPVPQVFLHFLWSELGLNMCRILRESLGVDVWERIMGQIINACKRCDHEEGGGGRMLKTLFNLHDPQGRTFLHVDFEYYEEKSFIFSLTMSTLLRTLESDDISPPLSRAMIVECLNARDAAGRTLLHSLCIQDSLPGGSFNEMMETTAKVLPLRGQDLKTLLKWCFPDEFGDWCNPDEFDCRPIHLIVLFNSTIIFNQIFPFKKCTIGGFWYDVPIGVTYDDKSNFKCYEVSTPLQIAAYLGRTTLVEGILQHHTKYNSTLDAGLGNLSNGIPAILCAALSGQVEAIQSILKYPVYDPIIQDECNGTALHVAVKQSNLKVRDLKKLQVLACMCTLPNSQAYKRIQKDFTKCEVIQPVPRMYSANEKSCINLLLQAGIDIWTPHPRTKQFPSPGSMADDDANIWWYDKVVKEVVTAKTSISYAANATSVVAALVATGSFIGPFQPPLGYASTDGYVQAERSPVRVYLVSNSLSFFLSVASILMAVLPAIPMPKESLYDELLRSQRCVKASALMLLIAIICVLISFSSASIAVVSPDWQEKQLIVACIVCGGAVCLVVLVVYIIRLLRMLFHRNAGIRRRFAKYMYF